MANDDDRDEDEQLGALFAAVAVDLAGAQGKGRWLVREGSGDKEIHITPIGDLREHVDGPGCWCLPEVEHVEGGRMFTHNALDGRELVEQHGLN